MNISKMRSNPVTVLNKYQLNFPLTGLIYAAGNGLGLSDGFKISVNIFDLFSPVTKKVIRDELLITFPVSVIRF